MTESEADAQLAADKRRVTAAQTHLVLAQGRLAKAHGTVFEATLAVKQAEDDYAKALQALVWTPREQT